MTFLLVHNPGGTELRHVELRPGVALAWPFGVCLRRRILTDWLGDQGTTLFASVLVIDGRTVIGDEADVIIAVCFRLEVLDFSRFFPLPRGNRLWREGDPGDRRISTGWRRSLVSGLTWKEPTTQ